jgi:hypothetical protein
MKGRDTGYRIQDRISRTSGDTGYIDYSDMGDYRIAGDYRMIGCDWRRHGDIQ